jgi:hypothetical protein
LQKVLENANKAIGKSTKFINKIKSRQIAYAKRAKSRPENATSRKEYIKCGKEICEQKHGLTALELLLVREPPNSVFIQVNIEERMQMR